MYEAEDSYRAVLDAQRVVDRAGTVVGVKAPVR
jgi:hypothetical protein